MSTLNITIVQFEKRGLNLGGWNIDVPIKDKFDAPVPYKHTPCIPRWNDVETVLFTSFQRGIHVVCL